MENEIRHSKLKYISWDAKWYGNGRKKMILHCSLEMTKMQLEACAESRILIVTGTGGTLNCVSNFPQDRGKIDSSIKKQEMWL